MDAFFSGRTISSSYHRESVFAFSRWPRGQLHLFTPSAVVPVSSNPLASSESSLPNNRRVYLACNIETLGEFLPGGQTLLRGQKKNLETAIFRTSSTVGVKRPFRHRLPRRMAGSDGGFATKENHPGQSTHALCYPPSITLMIDDDVMPRPWLRLSGRAAHCYKEKNGRHTEHHFGTINSERRAEG